MSRDTSFYYSFLVLPKDKRRAIIAVWDFCRAVDDAVDDPAAAPASGRPREGLVRWREELAACYEGRPPATGQGRRLRPWIDRFRLPRVAFEHVIDGVEMDLETRRFATFGDLHQYCYRVASAVGLICIEIFGYRNPRARDYAEELGVALQLTNILRDVPADLARGRLYLPLEDLDRFGCGEGDLRAGRLTPSVRGLLEHQAARARDYYRRARAALPPEDARRLVAAQIMGAIYFAILQRIERAGCDVFSTTHRVPRPRRAWLAATTWLRTMAFGNRFG
jgi:15-cis-phytoene synthase